MLSKRGSAMRAALTNWEAALAGLALAIVCGAVTWGVIARYIAPTPATWSNEVATIGFAWIVFLGAAAGARQGLHIGVDLVTARLPHRVQSRLSIIVSVFLGLALGYIAMLAAQLGYNSWNRPTPVLRIPSSIVHVAAVLGFASMAVNALLRAAQLARGLDK
jgi:TRAP-type transport system small permease protein